MDNPHRRYINLISVQKISWEIGNPLWFIWEVKKYV